MLYLRQNSVVVNMIPVVAWLVGKDQFLDPFHAPSTDLAWDDGTQRTAMIRTQGLAIHFVGQHNSSVRVHDPIQPD